MYAMTLDEKREFSWCEVPDPVRKEGEVIIKVHAAAVNRADLMQKDGCYASPPEWPPWCGLECAGVIEETFEGSSFQVGDRVCALVGGGAYSQKVAVPAGMVIPIPDEMDMATAGSIPEVWCTAYLNLVKEGSLRAGETLFVQAGASGVGLAAIQLGKLLGAKVIASVGSPEKGAFIRDLGADVIVEYKKEDLASVLKENPPSVALDCVGGASMGEYLKTMSFGGRWIMIASLAGGKTEVDLETVWRKRLKLIGSTLRSRTNEEKSAVMKAVKEELLPKFMTGELVSNIHAVFPIAEVARAHQVLREAKNIGKVVLTFV